MKWITARDLEHWGSSLSARDQLPALVSDLIRATSSSIEDFRFPSGDKGQVRGFDGWLEAEAAPPFVPGGKSIWEFGVGADSKPDDDYDRRVAQVSKADRESITFVFVSLKTWDNPKKKLFDWINERKARQDWADVRYIDGMMLEHWLDSAPAVAARYASGTLGLMPITGATSTDEFWDRYSTQFSPQLTEEVLLCDRDDQAKTLLADLGKPSGTIALAADSPDEVIAFVVAAIRKAPPEARMFLEARTLVVDAEDAALQLAKRKNAVFLPRGQAKKHVGQFARVGPTVVAIGGADLNRDAQVLSRPSSSSLAKALNSMGIEYEEAYDLARSCGRSVTVLARLKPAGAVPPPAWIAQGPTLVPALLAGCWNSLASADTDVISQLAKNVPYADYETALRPLTRLEDPPIDRVDDMWKMRAPVDAFMHLGHLVGADDLHRLRCAVTAVFSELKPEPDPNAAFQVKPRIPEGYSDWLREGLATTLLQIAALHKPARFEIAGSSPQQFVNDLVAQLPGLKDNYRLLASLKRELPLLAEAAPDPFLSALEHLLEGDGKSLAPIFNEGGLLTPHSAHTGLLWALELLAWDPLLLRRVASVLAKLDKIDPGGRLSNRPINSLRQIFLPWVPNTNASLRERLIALDALVDENPEVGWKLLKELLPKGSDTSTPSARPRYREAGASDRERLTYQVVWDGQDAIVRRALKYGKTDARKLSEVFKHLGQFSEVVRVEAIALIASCLENATPEDRKIIWSALNDEVNRHIAYSDAKWALPAKELTRLQELVGRYQPDSKIEQVVWLFNDWLPDVPSKLDDPEKAIEAARREAILSVVASFGDDGITRLAQLASLPQFVGYSFVAAIDDASRYEALICQTAGTSDLMGQFAGAIFGAAARKLGDSWLERTKSLVSRCNLPIDLVAMLLMSCPDEQRIWQLATSLGPEVDDAYWKRKHSFGVRNKDDVRFVAEKFLSVGRPVAVIDAVGKGLSFLPSVMIEQVLEAVLVELNARSEPVHSMFSYHLRKAFEGLQESRALPKLELAKWEYAYLPLLEEREDNLTIHKIMAESPEFYVTVICGAFKARHAEHAEPSENNRGKASASYRLLNSFKLVPGLVDNRLDIDVLRTWVNDVHKRAKAADREAVADQMVGQLLARAPVDANDSGWPDKTVRILLEELKSDEIERGISMGRYNMRGVHWRGLYEGGRQERELASQYRAWSKQTAQWPRTSAMLERIAAGYDADAVRQDIEAEQDKRID